MFVVEVPLLRALTKRNSSSDRVSVRQHHVNEQSVAILF